MYGLILNTVRDLVVTKFGETVWNDLLAKLNLSYNFIDSKNYDDQLVYDLLRVSSQTLNVGEAEILEAIGYWFPIFVKSTTYGNVLHSAGNTLAEILTHINTMHGHIKFSYFPEMRPPVFRVTQNKENSLRLHYKPGLPGRKGLAPLIVGMIKSLGEEHLKLNVVQVVQKKWIDKGAPEDVFSVKWKAKKSQAIRRSDDLRSAKVPLIYGLDPQGLNQAFPFHLIFNQKLEVLQYGKSIGRLVALKTGTQLDTYFELVEPEGVSFSDWKFLTKKSQNEVFVFRNRFDGVKALKLKGQLIWQKSSKLLCFAGSPQLDSIQDLKYFGLRLSDFATYDPTKDTIFLNHAKETRRSEEDLDVSASLISSLSDSSDTLSIISELDHSGQPPLPISCPFSGQAGAAVTAPTPNSSGDTASPSSLLEMLFGSKLKSSYASKKLPEKNPSTRAAQIVKSSDNLSHILPKEKGDDVETGRKRSKSWSSIRELDLGDNIPIPTLTTPQGKTGSVEIKRVAIEAAGPLSVPGRERLENAFQELLLDDVKYGSKLVSELLTITIAESNGEKLSSALLELYNYHGKTFHFLQTIIESEIFKSNDPNVLLRSETVGTRVLSTFMNRAGKEYVRELVSPLIDKIEGLAATKFELLPNRTPSEKQTATIIELAQSFLDQICNSISSCPLGIRRVLRVVGEEVSRKWPHMQRSGILNILFLRFLNPAIISASTTNEGSRRIQLLVTKLLQKLANGIPFDEQKEEHLKPFNIYISESNQRMLSSYVGILTEESNIHASMNLRSRLDPYQITTPNVAALDQATSIIRDSFNLHLSKLWKIAVSDDRVANMLQGYLSVGLSEMYSTIGRS